MTHLVNLTLVNAKKALAEKKISSVELTQAFINRMDEMRHLNAYVLETPDVALEQAKQSDIRYKNGDARALEGLPLGIKDLFCTKGIRTTACSKILGNFVPTYESTVTQNLWDQGAVCLGKLNMDEFAMGSTNLTSCFGGVENPWKNKNAPNLKLVPGGSSGGSASAVSARMALAATASDTGGSIRQPASFCGLVGIKPTYGLCSRWGMVAFASSLDQAGPVAHTVADAALMLEHMVSFDEKDATSKKAPNQNYLTNLSADIKGIKVGIPKEYIDGLNPAMKSLLDAGIQWLKDAGADIREVSLTTTHYALPTYYIIAPAEASANLSRYDGVRYGVRVDGQSLDDLYSNTRGAGFGSEVKRRIMIGNYVLSSGYYDAYYIRAQKVQQLIREDFNRVFADVDILLTPTTPDAAFDMDNIPTDPVAMYLQDIYTVTVNLAGLPGISIPAGLNADGLPLGLQLIGPAFSEQRLLNVGQVIENAAAFPHLMKA